MLRTHRTRKSARDQVVIDGGEKRRRPAGRFVFARLLNVDGEKLHLLPPGTGQRQQVVSNPPWAAVAVRLIRTL